MRTAQVTEGTLEPVTIAELKLYVRSTSGAIEDALLTTLISSARKACEEFARMSIVERDWIVSFRTPRFIDLGLGAGVSVQDPERVLQELRLSRLPVKDVVSVKWTDSDGTVTELGRDIDWFFNVTNGKIYWRRSYPVARTAVSIDVQYTAGFPPNAVQNPTFTKAPSEVKMAVLQTAAYYYENRVNKDSMGVPASAKESLRGWWKSASIA